MTAITGRRRMDHSIFALLLLKRGMKSICKELHVGKERVREVREKARGLGYLDGSAKPPLAPLPLFPDPVDGRSLRTSEQDAALYEEIDWITERLTVGWKPITVFEELPVKDVSRSSFYRFMDRHGLYKIAQGLKDPVLTAPIIHEPGEALILDWGKIRDVFDPETQTERPLWAFIGVLGFSRYMMVRLVWTNDVATTFDALESMFREIGGIADKVTTDNPKCFSITASRYDPVLNPAFIRFAAHHDFKIECLPGYRANLKGKVEKLVPYVRRLFQAYPEKFVSLGHAQAYMDRKTSIANERKHGTTRLQPLTVFLEKEADVLKPLPAMAYEREEIAYPKVRRDSFVRFDNKFYAVSDDNVGKDTIVLATKDNVSIYRGGQLLEVYDRIKDPYQTHAIKEHLKRPWQKVEENNLHYLHMAQRIGPNVSRFVHALIHRGQGFVDTRKIWGVLSLEKKYKASAIDEAAATALAMGELSSRFVETLIRLHSLPQEKQPKPNTAAASKFSRPMTVYKEQLSLLKH